MNMLDLDVGNDRSRRGKKNEYTAIAEGTKNN